MELRVIHEAYPDPANDEIIIQAESDVDKKMEIRLSMADAIELAILLDRIIEGENE